MNLDRMSNEDLLTFLVGKKRAKTLAKTSLATLFDQPGEGIGERAELLAARELVTRYLYEDLRREPGLSNPGDVKRYLIALFAGQEHETFHGIFLDSQNRLIASETLFRGTLSQAAVYPREIVKRALRHNAAALIFAHNHPSGIAEPSRADEALTTSLKQALSLVDIKVLDHFIVAGPVCVSFAERGKL